MFSIGSSCSGDCKDCYIHFAGGCLAGHGDDHFSLITKKEAQTLLKKGWVKKSLIEELKEKFNIK